MDRYSLRDGLAVVGAAALVGLAVKKSADFISARRDGAKEAEIKELKSKLAAAESKVAESKAAASGDRKPIRVYIDGCFDMMHYGHSNALRQSRAVGDILVVGLMNDEEIIKNKGSPPIMNQDERYESLAACKFVDEVIRDAPYDLTKEWVDELVAKHDIDYVVHGDDPCITHDGKDAYAYAKSIGKFKQIKRTEGVSTTELVGRMLVQSREHHVRSEPGEGEEARAAKQQGFVRERSESIGSKPTAISTFLPTSHRIVQFASGRSVSATDKVVYVGGAWDLFNAGHLDILKAAKDAGTFVLVGIHDDETVNRNRGSGLPIMNIHERALSVLSCKYVDEVIIGAPLKITEDMVKSMNISVVLKGTVSDGTSSESEDADWYEVPMKRDLLRVVKSKSSLTAASIIERVMKNRAMFQARYDRKAKTEADYYADKKEFVKEG